MVGLTDTEIGQKVLRKVLVQFLKGRCQRDESRGRSSQECTVKEIGEGEPENLVD